MSEKLKYGIELHLIILVWTADALTDKIPCPESR
jgi:hypothetical protein